MAAKKKGRTRSRAATAKSRTTKAKTKGRTKKAANTARRSTARKGGAGKGSEVERCWAQYLQHRTALESAVEAVQAAQQELASAREIERSRRAEFDKSKQALERLLEVETAASKGGGPRSKPVELPAPPRSPASKGEVADRVEQKGSLA